MQDKITLRINALRGLLSIRISLFLTVLLLVPILLILSLLLVSSFLSSSGIFQHVMAQQQHNTLAFSSFAPVASSQIKNSSSVTILPTSSNNSLLYDNCTYGVRFQSPYGWKKVEILASRLTTVEFTSLGRNVSGSYSPHAVVDISIEKGLGNVTTLEQYREAADKLLLATLGNFTTIQSSQGTLSGLPAIERVLAIKQPISGIDIWITQVFTLKNSKAYTVTYTVPASRYIAYSPIVREIINSFQITK